ICFFFQAEDGIRDRNVTGVQTCALPILLVFAAQRSNWSIWMAAVLAASVTTLIYGYHRRLEASGETPVSGGFIRLPAMISAAFRSEERRVGKECRAGGCRECYKKECRER